ncbi:MAG TPA: site-specific integrase [Magnetospirillum sp.]|nr:site-specific integrase [Magnetospirillum sp.]
MRDKLTKRTVDAAKKGDRDLFIWDTELKGFGLKVTSAGRKVYLIQYRMPEPGKPLNKTAPRRYTIGEHGSPWTPEKARDRADKLLKLVDERKDPAELERAERQSEEDRRKEEEARQKGTFRNGLEDFLARRVRGKLVKARAVESLLHAKIPAEWLDRQANEIHSEDIQAAVDDLIAANLPGAAREFRKHLHGLFEFLRARPKTYRLADNPVASASVDAAYVPRDRVLDDGELVEVWKAAEAVGAPFGPMVKILILTGQRLREVGEAEWRELSPDGLWTIAAERAKNGKAHIVHISPQAQAVLDALPRIDTTDESGKATKPSPYLFTTTGHAPVSGFSKAKTHIDKAIAKARADAAGTDTAPMPPWTFHDLRRTLATGAARLGIAPHIVEKVLNHNPKALQGVAGIYNRFEYLPERQAALEAWGRHVARLVAGEEEASNVVPMRA